MGVIRAAARRLVGIFTADRRDRELAAELESHLQLHVDDNVRAGMTPEDARRHARLALGGVDATREAYRDRQGVPVIETLLRDLRYGARMLLKSPGFAAAAALILGLGIGANTAIFSVVNAVVLRPLPFPNADRIMRVWHTPPAHLFSGAKTFSVSPANYIDWEAQSDVFDAMAIYRFRQVNVTGRGEPDALRAAVVSEHFFPVLGVAPRIGRPFEHDDFGPGRSAVVLLGEQVWRSRFGADPSIVGQSIELNGQPHVVIGVMPSRVAFPERVQLWLPLVWTNDERAVRGNHNYLVIAQLRRGVDVRAAQAQMTTISARLEQQYPADDKGWGALVVPLHQDLVGDVRPALLILLGSVAFVLLIACANLANLLLAKTLGRAKEIAVRAALGASRGRIVQQLLAESALLGVAGGILGLLAARIGVEAIVGSIGQRLPRANEIDVDGGVLAFTAVVAVLTGLMAGVAPAWRLTRGDLNEPLKQGLGKGAAESGERRVRHVLVVSEVALALMLLVGAGLLIRTLWQLRAVDPGFDPRQTLTMTVAIPPATYPQPQQQVRFFDDALRRIRALPGVEAASGVDTLPLHDGSTQPVSFEGQAPVPLSEQPEVAVRDVWPDYVRTLRMRLLAGRTFTEADALDRPAVALISESMAQRFWPRQNPIGRHLTLGLMSNDAREVVGVVSDVKLLGLDVHDPVAAVYLPVPQVPFSRLSLIVRATDAPGAMAPAVSRAIHEIDPQQPILDVLTMEEVIGQSLDNQRFAMFLLSAFAALALALAAVGIYSVLSYTVRQRVREIGIRMALGAPAADVLRMVVVEGMKPTLLGLVIGLVSAAALGRFLATLIFGISVRDALTFGSVSAVILVVGLIASLVPAYRATRVDPLLALRSD